MKRLLLLLCIFLSLAWVESVPKIYGQVPSSSTCPFRVERLQQTCVFDSGHVRVDIQLPVVKNNSLYSSFFGTDPGMEIKQELIRSLLGDDYINMPLPEAIDQFANNEYKQNLVSHTLKGEFSTVNEHYLTYRKEVADTTYIINNSMLCLSYKDILLFDAKTGQLLHQDDIFKQNEAFRQTLIEYIANKNDVNLASVKPNDNFDITPDGTVIYYYNGLLLEEPRMEIKIPIKTLASRGLLVPNSPVVKYFARKFISADTKKALLNELNDMAKETLQEIMDEDLTEMELRVLEATVVSKRPDNNGFNGIAIVQMADVKRLKVLFTMTPYKDSYYIEIPSAELNNLINEYDEL